MDGLIGHQKLNQLKEKLSLQIDLSKDIVNCKQLFNGMPINFETHVPILYQRAWKKMLGDISVI